MKKYFIFPSELPHLEFILKRKLSNKPNCTLSGWSQISIGGYRMALTITPSDLTIGILLEVTDEELWILDEWKPMPFFERKEMEVVISENNRLQAYCHIFVGKTTEFIELSPEDFLNIRQRNSTPYSDIHLMIPCSFEACNSSTTMTKETCEMLPFYFIKQIEKTNKEEFSNPFVKMLKREFWGMGYFTNKNNDFFQPCSIIVSKHLTTKLGIINIFTMNVYTNGNCILEEFRYGTLYIHIQNKTWLLTDWLYSIGLKIFGEPKNILFSSKPLQQDVLINALASEYNTMGKITGKDFRFIASDNIAVYDTAEVYVSEVTLIELNKQFQIDVKERLASQAIEIFFIELMLLQDAAIGRISAKINDCIAQENNGSKCSMKLLEELVCEISQSTLFFEPTNFRFPTVRMAARKISEKFGLNRSMEAYQNNKKILEQLMDLHRIQKENKENNLINFILIMLTIIQVFPILSGAIHYIIFKEFNLAELISETLAFSILTILFIFLYRQKRKNNIFNN